MMSYVGWAWYLGRNVDQLNLFVNIGQCVLMLSELSILRGCHSTKAVKFNTSRCVW